MNFNFKTASDTAKILSISEKIKLIQEITAQIESELKIIQPKPYKSLRGIWKRLDIDEKEISEARKEMWDNFPREDI